MIIRPMPGRAVRTLLCMCLLIAACSDTPADPGGDTTTSVDRYELLLTRDRDVVWTGDTVYYSVHSEVPIPPECEYKWDLPGRSSFLSRDTVQAAYFHASGKTSVHVRVMNGKSAEETFYEAEDLVDVQQTTGVLRIDPDSALWDIGVALPLSVNYGGRVPDRSRIVWDFSDGTSAESPAADTIRHIFSSPGSYHITAALTVDGTDSVIASSTSSCTVTEKTAGRFIRFEIEGLERSFTTIQPRSPDPYILTEDIGEAPLEYLRWEGNRFILNLEYPNLKTLRIEGAMRGDDIDSLRIESFFRFNGTNRKRILLRDIPAAAEGVWELRGDDCAAGLAEYYEYWVYFRSWWEWDGSKWVQKSSEVTREIASHRFLEDAGITISIGYR